MMLLRPHKRVRVLFCHHNPFHTMRFEASTLNLEALDGSLRLRVLESSRECTFPPAWLADQCRCPTCFHDETMQRLRSESVSSSHSNVAKVEECGSNLVKVSYENPNVHETIHPVSHLFYAATGAETRQNQFRLTQPLADTATTLIHPVPVSKVMSSDEGLLEVLNTVDQTGYCFIDGLETTEDFTRRVLERIGYLRNSIFGDFWSFSVDTSSTNERLEHADTAYTGLAIEPHTDGSYDLEPPGLQSFHVLKFESEMKSVGSILVDGFSVAKSFQLEFPEHFKLLCETDLDWRYNEAHRTHLHALAPIIKLDSKNAEKIHQIRFNHYDRGDLRHLLHDSKRLNQVLDAIGKWRTALLETRHKIEYELTPGRMVIFDNWRVLHGRKEFVGKRSLCGAYHDRQLFLSRLSVLRKESSDKF